MEEHRKKKKKLELQLRAKSPIIMSNKYKMTSLNSNSKSVLNMNSIDENSKKSQENKEWAVDTSIIQLPKTLKHLNLCSNLQSTPNARNYKSEVDSRIIMNLSPITPTTSLQTNSNTHQNIFRQKLFANENILLDELNTNQSSLSTHNEDKFLKKLKTNNETVKNLTYKNKMIHSSIDSKTNEDNNVAENTKRCLFEKEKTNSTFNLDTDQDSLNISLDILEQVCQMSEIIDGSTEEIQVENNTDKKKNKLSFFLYGNNSTILEETEEENELLQFALSMEDNILTETKPKNNICSDGGFTSLTQLKNMEYNLFKTDSKRPKNNINNADHTFLGPVEINDIGNTQMCEIADITETLEQSFDDQWTQQYTTDESNINQKKMLNGSFPNSSQITFITDQILKLSKNNINHEVDKFNDMPEKIITEVHPKLNGEPNKSMTIKDKPITNPNKCQGFSTAGGKSIKISDQALKKVHSVLNDELNESPTIIKDKHMISSNICLGFSTAGGKSIKISDQALKKVHLVLRDELNESPTIIKDKPITNPNMCQGFSTAGGKSIKISDQALKKVHSVLNDELNESPTIIKDKHMISSNICLGFSTAGGKSIKISDQALKKVHSVLNDELNESPTIIKDKPITNPNICQGFSTAGGKSIKISDQALKKSHSVLNDELNESPTIIKDKPITNPNMCQGFSTAGGKSIKISDQALKKVHSVLNDELNESPTIIKDKPITNPNMCQGFSTAGGKSIKISDQALKKVHSVLNDELNESPTIIKDKPITNPNMCQGFSTAGGKSIKISDQALKKSHSVLNDEPNESPTIIKDKPITNPNICQGFSTAGGKSIKISDQALKKVHSVLRDELNDSSTLDKTINNSSISQNISIAKDKSINISDKAFQKCQSQSGSNKDINVLKLLDNSPESMAAVSTDNCSYLEKILKNSIVENKKKDNYFENSKNEDCTLEDLSLVDMVDKFEREQSVCESVLSNKRPGSPIFELHHKIKKNILYDNGWEIGVLKLSFDEYLMKKLRGPKVSLPEAINWILPKHSFPENDLKEELNKLNYDDNFLNFMLHWEKNFKLSDGSINKKYSFRDIKNLFLSHDFVDNKIIPKRWIENHFRLIIWKLSATEISFPDHFRNTLLTAKNVIHQLLYRYYREIEKCQRSALKKILEKDETASKRIIVCVSKIIKTNLSETYDIELTDGWYSVHGLIDYEMNTLLHKGIVKVGTKLIIHNAELIGAGEGIDPLEVHDGIKLKFSTNSTRRVRWHTKLGFYKNSLLPITVSLESVLPRGGIIGSLSLVILRKYPIMYLEKKKNSKSIIRNEKMETIEAEKYKAYQQKSLEIISNKIETEMIVEMETTKKSKQYLLSFKKDNLDKLSIEELSNIIDNSPDPLDIQLLLKEDKLKALENFKKSEHERFNSELQNRVNKMFIDQFKDARKVIPLFKLRVVDKKYASTGCKSAMLTIWNPLEDVSAILNKSCEGQFCTINYLTTNGFINDELQISTTKNTRLDFKGFINDYAKREVVQCFKSIWSGTFVPLFGELDFVGIVVSSVYKINNIYSEIYVSDKEMNIVNILFRGNIKNYGCDDLIQIGNIISGMNVQFRGFKKSSNELTMPKLYNTELSSFTTIPKTELLLDIFNGYKMFMNKSENQNFLICCQSRLNKIHSKNVEKLVTNNDSTRKQCLNTSKNSFHKSYGEIPVTVVKTSNTSQSEFSPVQKRIKMLNSYGKTPPLNIVHTKPPDKILMSQFKTPTRL